MLVLIVEFAAEPCLVAGSLPHLWRVLNWLLHQPVGPSLAVLCVDCDIWVPTTDAFAASGWK